jgi:hypothetical protein
MQHRNSQRRKRPRARPELTQRQLRLTLISSLIGTALEWYDFYLYGTAAAFNL